MVQIWLAKPILTDSGGQESDGAMLADGCQDVDIPELVIFRILYSI